MITPTTPSPTDAPVGPRLQAVPGPLGINWLVLVRPAARQYASVPATALPKRPGAVTPAAAVPAREPWLRPANADALTASSGRAHEAMRAGTFGSLPADEVAARDAASRDPGVARYRVLREASRLPRAAIASGAGVSHGAVDNASLGRGSAAMRERLCEWLELYCGMHHINVPTPEVPAIPAAEEPPA